MKVTVIGAGILGVTSAYYLQQQGAQVTVIEQEAKPSRGTSYANGGYLQATVTDTFNGPGALGIFAKAWFNGLAGRGESSAFYTRTTALPGLVGWGLKFLRHCDLNTYLSHTLKNQTLGAYSVRLTKEIMEQESLEAAQSERGGLIIYRDQRGLHSYIEVAKMAAEQGGNFEVLDQQGLLAREPALAEVIEGMAGAVYLPDDYSASARSFCEQLTELLEQRGVEFRFNSAVQGIVPEGNQARVLLDDSELSADNLIIAAGNHSKTLAAPLGIKLPIAPIKGYSLSVPMNGWDNRPRHTIIDMDKHAGINPLGDVLRVAGTAELSGLRPGISKRRIKYLIGLAGELFPQFAASIDPDDETLDPWGGHRPISPDGLPMIGPTRHPRIYINSGHGGMGWSQAAGSARALADTMMGNTPEISLEDFSVARFN